MHTDDVAQSGPLPRIAILGAGSMGGAILQGLVRSGQAPHITRTNRTTRSAQAVDGAEGVRSVALEVEHDGNVRAAAEADIVLIGVKPVMVADLLREIAPALRPG